MSKSHKGKTHTEETKRKIGDGNRGKTRSEESKQKISKAKKGVPWTEEHRRNFSKSRTGKKNKVSVIQPIVTEPIKTENPVQSNPVPEIKTHKPILETVRNIIFTKVSNGFKRLASLFKKRNEQTVIDKTIENTSTDSVMSQNVNKQTLVDEAKPVKVTSAEQFRIVNDLPKIDVRKAMYDKHFMGNVKYSNRRPDHIMNKKKCRRRASWSDEHRQKYNATIRNRQQNNTDKVA